MATRSMRPKGQLETALGVAKVGAMLIGAASVGAAVVKLAVPFYKYVVFAAFPAAWAGFRSFLAPQYLFLLVNLIILVIWKLSEKKTPDTPAPAVTHAAAAAAAAAPPHASPLKPKVVPVDVVPPSPRMRHVNDDIPPLPSPRMLPRVIEEIPPPSPRMLPRVGEDIPPPSPRKLGYSHVDAMPSPRKPAAYGHANTLPAPSPLRKPNRDDAPPTPRNGRRPPSPDSNSDDSCVTADDDSAEYHSPEPVSPLRHSYRRLAVIATPSRSAPVTPHPASIGGPDADAPESLEDAWKAITGAGTPRLRKNETWAIPPRVVEIQPAPVAAARREMRKSETFNEATRRRPAVAASGARAGRADMWERDELNQKFDAFIKKVNDQFRLQRQESEQRQRYASMVRRGY